MSLIRTDRRNRVERIRDQVREVTDVVSDELRDGWETVRENLDDLSDLTERRWAEIRASLEDVDGDQLRADIRDSSRTAGRALMSLGIDVKDITTREADRLAAVIEESAAKARAEAEEAERQRRVKALIGWALFGLVAGAVLATRLGGPGDSDDPTEVEGQEETAQRTRDPQEPTDSPLDAVKHVQ